jgi:hypothetical protein
MGSTGWVGSHLELLKKKTEVSFLALLPEEPLPLPAAAAAAAAAAPGGLAEMYILRPLSNLQSHTEHEAWQSSLC